MMDPAFGFELAHEGVDEGKARLTVLPPPEPCLGEGGVDCVSRNLIGETGGRVDLIWEVPGYEATVAVMLCLIEHSADAALRSKVHVAE